MATTKTKKRSSRKAGKTKRRGTGAGPAGRSRPRAQRPGAKSAGKPARECWLTIPSFPDYESSNCGRIRRKNGAAGTQAGRILKPRFVRGYLRVDLRKKGENYNKGVASLVAETFIGKPPKYKDAEGRSKPKLITHSDGNRDHNWPGNLVYLTRPESVRARMPARNSQAKLTPGKVKTLRKLYAGGWSGADLARRYDVSVSAALSAAQHKTWKDVA